MQRLKNNDRGQSGTIVAILMVPLMAMLALAIDVGAMHLDKQQLQTGADAAALAIAQDCAHSDCSTANSTADAMANANFHGDGASGTVTALNVSERTVTVQTDTIREHWFAPVLGIHSTPIQATASARWEHSASIAGTLPLAFSWCALDAVEDSGTAQVLYSTNNGCQGLRHNAIPGGFGWLTPGDSTCKTLTWVKDGWAKSDPGNNPSCKDVHLRSYIGQPVFVPIFDAAEGSGTNASYRIIGYASFRLSGYYFSGTSYRPPCGGSDRCMSGTFERFVPLSESSDPAGTAVVTLTE
ncbi:Tad domain-containing protein [Enteractinococcus coprophilus]|uniref:Putative Flp pilus-assembly TadE/G-like protein n=1 Tax=Enteractinococcus coprophilus TaxID=1027633 RepID=A0A543AGF5_9MICC|nr:Tad domain-containing protein [Enteractinococcus coprophilus]TQL71650.1 putative Flp pilus-assembly TadE/G-like protein [Enteractinococcus coprophilus]